MCILYFVSIKCFLKIRYKQKPHCKPYNISASLTYENKNDNKTQIILTKEQISG